MKLISLFAATAVGCATLVHAADTPGSNPSMPAAAPSAPDRMASARQALGSGNYASAIRDLQAVVHEDPRNADAHNLLGYSYRKRPGPDITKAFEHYYTALRIDPRHKGAHEYIGQAYLMEKKPDQAEKHLAELEKICGGRGCPEYLELSKAIGEFKSRN